MSQNKQKTTYPIFSIIVALIIAWLFSFVGYTFLTFTAGFDFHIVIPLILGIIIWSSGTLKVKISGSKQ